MFLKLLNVIFLMTIHTFLVSVLIAGALGTSVLAASPLGMMVAGLGMLIHKELQP